MTTNVDADRWQRLAEVLDAALARDPNDWPEVLDAACVGAPDLRREAQQLLERVDDARRFLTTPPSNIAAAIVAEADDATGSAPGRRIGAYSIVREIGRGGMSRVSARASRRRTIRAARRAQAAAPRPRLRRGSCTIPRRASDRRVAQPPEHRAAARRRTDRWRSTLPRARVRRRPADRRVLRRARALGTPPRRAFSHGRRCDAVRASQPDHPSRPQTVEHFRRRRRQREAARFRPREAARAGRDVRPRAHPRRTPSRTG